MTRLIPEAQYSTEIANVHHLSDHRKSYSIDLWERAAERAMEDNPNGAKSFALLRQMQLRSATIDGLSSN